MQDPVYIPLRGDGKQPGVKGWADPDYAGVEPEGRVGRRADGLVIVDCDSDEAASAWRDITGGAPDTLTVSTPRGWHFYYLAGPGDPTGPAVGVLDGIDIRAGSGSYVVCPPTPGYELVGRRRNPTPFHARWLPKKTQPEVLESAVEEWDTIPDGRRNATLAAFAGAFRRQGMDASTMYQLMLGVNEGLCDPPLPSEEIEVICRSVARYEPDPDFSIEIVSKDAPDSDDGGLLQWLSTMTLPPPPEWWWKPYLPKGRLVLLDGSEGIGKGLFCAHLATLVAKEAPVLWMATEDDPEEDIQRRMLATGWNPGSHHDVGFFTKDPKFPNHIDVAEALIDHHSAGLVVMDPGRSFLAPPDGSHGMSYNDEAHIRPGLEAINRLAKSTGCTIVFVHHWNKNTQATVQYRQGGSGGFAQVVRHRITLAWHGPTVGGEGAFEVSKSNIGPKGAVHGYDVDVVNELDTAAVRLGQPMPEYADLGEWMKELEATNAAGIEVVSKQPTLEAELRHFAVGVPIPPIAELAANTGATQIEVHQLLEDLEKEGFLRRGPRNKLIRAGEDER